MDGAFLVAADVEYGSCASAINENRRFGVGAFSFPAGLAKLAFMEHVFRAAVGLPRSGLRYAERFFAFRFERLDADLHESFHLRFVALPVRAG
jgi:hypothetical protein